MCCHHHTEGDNWCTCVYNIERSWAEPKIPKDMSLSSMDDRLVHFIWYKIRMCPIKPLTGTIKSLKQMNRTIPSGRVLSTDVMCVRSACHLAEKLIHMWCRDITVKLGAPHFSVTYCLHFGSQHFICKFFHWNKDKINFLRDKLIILSDYYISHSLNYYI